MNSQTSLSYIEALAVFHIPANPPQIAVINLQNRRLMAVMKGKLMAKTPGKGNAHSRIQIIMLEKQFGILKIPKREEFFLYSFCRIGINSEQALAGIQIF